MEALAYSALAGPLPGGILDLAPRFVPALAIVGSFAASALGLVWSVRCRQRRATDGTRLTTLRLVVPARPGS